MWLIKCKWGEFLVFVLKCYLMNVNGVTECELKTATKIVASKRSKQLDHKCTCIVLTKTECNLCAAWGRIFTLCPNYQTKPHLDFNFSCQTSGANEQYYCEVAPNREY